MLRSCKCVLEMVEWLRPAPLKLHHPYETYDPWLKSIDELHELIYEFSGRPPQELYFKFKFDS